MATIRHTDNIYRNASGYRDPTAGKALSRVESRERKRARVKDMRRKPQPKAPA